MFKATRVLASASIATVKQSTGLVGLAVVPNARDVLTTLYKRTLEEVKVIPEGVAYRDAVEKFTNFRLGVVQANASIETIEDTINCGQVEELIRQAQEELELIPEYAGWKAWEWPEAKPDLDHYGDIMDMSQVIHPAGTTAK